MPFRRGGGATSARPRRNGTESVPYSVIAEAVYESRSEAVGDFNVRPDQSLSPVAAGDFIIVVYEELNGDTVRPVTAYEVPERKGHRK